MNKSRNPLRLNVGYLYNKPIGTSCEIPIEYEKLRLEDLTVHDLISLVRISRTREGLLLQIKIEGGIDATCVRCLDSFQLPVRVEFEELFEFPSRYREETDLVLPDDGFIDLRPLYREYLILSLPIKPLCRLNCMGLCAICGANLNMESCEHHPEIIPSSSII